jgi:hypothetical protein
MNIFVKPKTDLKIMKPETATFLNSEGELVLQTSYWLRRISDGDVILIEQKEQTQTKLDSPKSKKSE